MITYGVVLYMAGRCRYVPSAHTHTAYKWKCIFNLNLLAA